MRKFNKNLLIGIIIVSSVLVICLIILAIFLLKRKYGIKAYNPQVDESANNNNNKKNNINNKLEIKNQNTGTINNV